MSGTAHPIDEVIEDGVAVAKGDVRSYARTSTILVIGTVSEIRAADLAGQLVIKLKATGRDYNLDTSDTTTVDDGVNCIRDANGLAFKLVVIDGLDGLVTSVNAQTGDVVIDAADLGLRTPLASDRTFYIDAGAASEGDGTSGSPFKTLQNAYNTVQSTYVMGYGVTITFRVKAGTAYAAGVVAVGPIPGQRSNLQVRWDLEDGVEVNAGDTPLGAFGVMNYAQYQITQLDAGSPEATVTALGSTGVAVAAHQGTIGFSTTAGITFNGGYADLYVGAGGGLYTSNFKVTGNKQAMAFASATGGVIECLNGIIEFVGTPEYAVATMWALDGGLIGSQSQLYSGAAVGKRYKSEGAGSNIETSHEIPGDEDGETSGGGAYNKRFTSLKFAKEESTPDPDASTAIQIVGKSGTDSRIELETYGGTPYIILRRNDGTLSSPTGNVANDALGIIGFCGRDSSGNRTDPQASVIGYATATWSNTSRPTQLDFFVTPSGSTTQVTKGRLNPDGGWCAPPGVTGGSQGDGTWNVSGGYYIAGTSIYAGSRTVSGAWTFTAAPTFNTSQASFNRNGNPFVFVTERTDTHGSSAQIAAFQHYGRNASGAQTQMAAWGPVCESDTASSESGYLQFQTRRSGSQNERLRIGGGVYHPSASGGDKGDNTINFGAVYDDNSLLTCPALAKEFLGSGKVDLDKWDAMVPDVVHPEAVYSVPLLEDVTSVEEIYEKQDDGSYIRRPVRKSVRRQVIDLFPVYDVLGNGIDAVEVPAVETVVVPSRKERRVHRTAHLFSRMIADGFDPRDPKAYIKKLRKDEALPGMPSQADWTHNSLCIGELHSRLWLAVEMLALVVLNHEDRITALEGEGRKNR